MMTLICQNLVKNKVCSFYSSYLNWQNCCYTDVETASYEKIILRLEEECQKVKPNNTGA